jgi:hypothetical protein
MSYAQKNLKNLVGSIFVVILVAAIAIWHFYSFVTFKDLQGGMSHLWIAIALTVLACGGGFLVLSVFVRHDSADDLHITLPPRA